jgi:UTP--glucose-1-phosphate uridylyltransferase
MLPFSKRVPKEMLPLNGVPAIQIVVEECVASGFRQVIVVTRPGDNIVREHLCELASQGPAASGPLSALDPARNWPGDLALELIEEQVEPRYGSGVPLLQLRERLAGERTFAVAFADDIVLGAPALGEVVDAFSQCNSLAAIGCQAMPRERIAGRFGNLEIANPTGVRFGTIGTVTKFLQRPALSDVRSDYAVVSRLALTTDIFDEIDRLPMTVELDVGLALAELARRTHDREGPNVVAVALSGQWHTVGDPASYAHAVYATQQGVRRDDHR